MFYSFKVVCSEDSKENNEKNRNNDIFTIKNQEINSDNIIEIIKNIVFSESTPTEISIVFHKCNFLNISKCIKKIIQNQEDIKVYSVIFNKCSPTVEIENAIKYSDNKISFSISGNNILKNYSFERSYPIVTIKDKRKSYGENIKFSDIKRFDIPDIFTVYSSAENLKNARRVRLKPYLMINNDNKKPIYKEKVLRYIGKTMEQSYFNDFFNKFTENIEKEDMWRYEIIVLESNEIDEFQGEIKKILKMQETKGQKTVKKYFESFCIYFNHYNTLFLISSPLSFSRKKYIYSNSEHPLKQKINTVLNSYSTLLNSNLLLQNDKINKENDFSYLNYNGILMLFTKINGRDVVLYNFKKVKNSEILSRIIKKKENFILTLYTRYGLNYIIYKLHVEQKCDLDKAIDIVLGNFIQFLIISS